MAVAFGPTSCSSCLVPKSKLLHSPETQYGFVPKHSHHGGKNIAVFAHEVCDVSARDEDARWIFCPGACSRGKISTLNLVRTESPTHTEVRVFSCFCEK